MSIVFGGDSGIQRDSFDGMIDGVLSEYSRIKDGLRDGFNKLTGKWKGSSAQPLKENVYVDDGFQNVPGTVFTGSGNLGDIDDIKTRKITTQAPMFTVYIKKKMFWSLRNEHDTKFMDPAEKLFIRASKLLFERKCAQIASYEAMTKLERLIDEEAELDVQSVEQVRDLVQNEFIGNTIDRIDEDTDLFLNDPLFTDNFKNKILSVSADAKREIIKNAEQIVKELGELIGKARQSKQAVHTTWVVDTRSNVDNVKIGRGVGVIELTLVDSVKTSLSLETGNMGSVSFTAQDPYNLMSIANNDIEIALSAALRPRAKDAGPDSAPLEPLETRGAQALLEEARRKDEDLKKERNSRLSGLTFDLIQNKNILGGSNLSEIVFEINPSSASPNKVSGRITSLSEPFNKDNFRIVFLQLPTEQQLTITENDLVLKIFELLESYVVAINAISGTGKKLDKSEDTEYARRQLRKFYLGKSIVQPMDGVHIYIRSNTFRDAEPIGPLSVLLNDHPFIKSFSSGSDADGANDAVLQEEMRQFKIKNIPVGLYRKLRTSSLLRNAGTHVFGGLISTVSSSYNAARGEYTLQVSGESNMKWLKLSRVNVAPSLDQPRGVLEDPLTPLKLNVDRTTGLILGDPKLSDENQKRMLFYKDGELEGERLTEENMPQDVIVLENKAFAVRQHAPGLVYRWKEGVISATQQSSLRTSLRGGTPLIKKLRRDVGVTITKDGPFANLDVADVISLLVTGVPHNYESFFINAMSVGSFSQGGEANSPESFFHSFFDINRSTNRALGNFVPFKQIDVTPKQMSDRLRLQSSLIRDNTEITSLQSQIAQDLDVLNQIPQNPDPFSRLPKEIDAPTKIAERNRNNLMVVIKERNDRLNELMRKFSESIKTGADEGLRVYGNDIIVENTDTNDSGSAGSAEAATKTKLRTALMQLRPQVSAKLNMDNNLFVVSDEYDKDLDIQAFVTELNSGEMPMWNSQYKTPIDTCINAAKVIDFEFFCDTQGNIQLRPPQYNKIPISLLSKMLLLGEKGIDLLPPFIRSLFSTRQESLEDTSEVLQIEIEIINLLLFGTKEGKGKITNTAGTKEVFNTNKISGVIGLADVLDLNLNDAASQIADLKNDLAHRSDPTFSVDKSGASIREIETEVSDLRNSQTPNVNTRRLDKLNKLIQLSSRKQRVDETLKKLENTSVKITALNNDPLNPTKGRGSELKPGQLSTLLEPFGNLLEDDSNDFLGPGSSGRFTIFDSQIISYDFKESDSNVHCRVDVTGQPDLLGEQPGQIGGVPALWAGATDFDLWKQYGWRQLSSANKPYFKNAETQCAPYALMLLSIQRRDTVRASITVVGNEYYQLGDVVYINSRDSLYYVYGVSHNFSFSGSFTTTLDLRYGHALGEFIPTPLDVIGKSLIKNQRKFNTTFMYRSTAGTDKGRCAGVILFKPLETDSVADAQKQMLEGDIGEFNLRDLKNALLRINSQKDALVDIRGFTRSRGTQEDKILIRMQAVKEWLVSPISGFIDNENRDPIQLDSDDFPKISESRIKKFTKQLKLRPILVPSGKLDQTKDKTEIKLEELDKKRGPSEESYNLMLDPTSTDGEFNTIEIVLVFEEE